jgi:O-antigen ligase
MPVSWRRRAELGALIALCFFLPLYEAPKSIAWLAYVAIWLANRAAERDFGGRWDGWDTLIAAWLVSGLVVAPFAALHGHEWHASLDIVRNGAVLWLVKRSRLDEREIRMVLGALLASTVIGLAMAFAKVSTGSAGALSLNSVGHVNHTAIYLAIMLGVCAAWLFSGERRVLAAAVSLLVLVSVVITASRGAVGIALATVVLLGAAFWRRSRLPALVALGVVVIYVLLALAGGTEVFEKNQALLKSHNALAFRGEVWQLAWSTWLQHPWFGIGIDNFPQVVDPSRRVLYTHGHNLYLNTLAERGIVGALPLFAIMIAWAVTLLRRFPAAAAGALEWVLWGGAASALFVSAGVGLVNTTLHHEHGLLAALLLGLWLAHTYRR